LARVGVEYMYHSEKRQRDGKTPPLGKLLQAKPDCNSQEHEELANDLIAVNTENK
jgi:hypothetical protein